ncbi:hypothetical protein ACFXHA_06865 [Nocardia sp. NPDC059240]|uniref:hypothetical protein n=1 Tax=Nocardia sp. NPDC059240 TaxID=3346786 RepID=UPI0036B0CFB0
MSPLPHQADSPTSTPGRQPLKRRLELDLRGDLTPDRLDRLRRNLGLVAVNSSGEPANTVLGERAELQPNSGITRMVMTFSRVDAQQWSLTIDAVLDTDLDPWQCLTEIACRVAGLSVVANLTAFDSPHACQFCGRYVLEVEGWAESLRPGHKVLAPWSDDPMFFHGCYHWSCVRASEFGPKFRTELLNWICGTEHLVTARGEDGLPHDTMRTGLGYTRHLATVPSGDIYESLRFDRWVFAETAGPIHFLDFDQALALSQGKPLRGNSGGRPAFLPERPGDVIAGWGLDELLNFLRIRDLYQDLIDGNAPEYSFWRGAPKRSGYVLTYSLSAIRPIPGDVSEFFRHYLPRYALEHSLPN